ncbi:hypothetical protein [Saccharopolyspora pogona]|nr:hypothetical protein [Saccharopolyspora pogona]
MIEAPRRGAQDAFYAALDPITIEDLVAAPTGPALLSLSPRPPAD